MENTDPQNIKKINSHLQIKKTVWLALLINIRFCYLSEVKNRNISFFLISPVYWIIQDLTTSILFYLTLFQMNANVTTFWNLILEALNFLLNIINY